MQTKNHRRQLWIVIGILVAVGLGWLIYNAITSGRNMKRLAEISNMICVTQYNDMIDNARADNASADVIMALEQARPEFCECYTKLVLDDANVYLNMPLGQVLEVLVKDDKGIAYECIEKLFYGDKN